MLISNSNKQKGKAPSPPYGTLPTQLSNIRASSADNQSSYRHVTHRRTPSNDSSNVVNLGKVII